MNWHPIKGSHFKLWLSIVPPIWEDSKAPCRCSRTGQNEFGCRDNGTEHCEANLETSLMNEEFKECYYYYYKNADSDNITDENDWS